MTRNPLGKRPMTVQERLERSKQALLERGGRRIHANLSPEAVDALATLTTMLGTSERAAIEVALRATARRSNVPALLKLLPEGVK